MKLRCREARMQRQAVWLGLLTIFAATMTHADDARRNLADKHAPAGIMGDHMHLTGQWMVEYRYMNMYMEDNRIGESTVSDAVAIGPGGPPPGIEVDGIRTNGGATPTQMTMEMHMLHLMYGATDDLTLYTMLMLPSLTMDHVRGDGNPAGRGTDFTTHNSGFGDTGFGALLRLFSDVDEDLILNLGGTVPTGDIYRTSTAPTGGLVRQPLPFPMRLGTGTFNARPGITYKRYFDWYSWGVQFQTDLPIGRNYRGYSVGETYLLNSWTSVLLTDAWSVSLRGEYGWRTNYDGNDDHTPDLVISTNVESFRGGQWQSIGLGTQIFTKGHYLNFELVPVMHQDLDGIQLETDYSVIASYSRSW